MITPYRIQHLLALLLFPTVMIYCASFPPIGSSSEAREVHIARIIYETGNWILPERNGILPSKPPLYHWLVAAMGHLTGGVDESIARAVSIISATFMLIAVMQFCGWLYRSSPASAALSQSIAGIITASCYIFLSLATNCRVDMVFATCTSIALLIALRNILEERLQFREWIIFWVCSGLAVLAKGPLGLALPILITTLFIISGKQTLLSKQSRKKVVRNGLIGLCLAGTIATPWYILAIQQGGESFIDKQLLFENIKRISGGSHMNAQNWYYYGPAFLRSFFPWSLLYLYAFLYPSDALRIYGNKHLTPSTLSRSQHLSHLWIIGVLTLFTLASGKRSSYLLPLLPAIVIACTVFLMENLRRQSHPQVSRLNRIRIVVGNSGIVLFSLVATGVIFYLTDAYYLVSMKHNLIRKELYHYTTIYVVIFGLGALLILLGRFAFLLRPYRSISLLYAGTWIGLIAILSLGISVKNSLKGFVEQARIINSLVPQDAQLYVIRKYRQEYFDPLMYYLHRPVRPVYPDKFHKLSTGTTNQFYVLGLDNELQPLLGATNLYTQITTLTPPTDATRGATDHTLSLWHHADNVSSKS